MRRYEDVDIDWSMVPLNGHNVPERGLCSAVLERAARDLNPRTARSITVDALQWFRGSKKPYIFSFKSVTDILELSAAQIGYLKQAIQEAKERINYR